MNESIALLKRLYEFASGLDGSEISALIEGTAQLRLEGKPKSKQPKDLADDGGIIEALDTCGDSEAARALLSSRSVTVALLKRIAAHYDVAISAKHNKSQIAEKIVKATVEAKQNFGALLNPKH